MGFDIEDPNESGITQINISRSELTELKPINPMIKKNKPPVIRVVSEKRLDRGLINPACVMTTIIPTTKNNIPERDSFNPKRTFPSKARVVCIFEKANETKANKMTANKIFLFVRIMDFKFTLVTGFKILLISTLSGYFWVDDSGRNLIAAIKFINARTVAKTAGRA